jgi:hypothetical protein
LRLRANPAYELVLFDRLSPSEQEALDALRHDPDLYGVLRPRNNARLTMKSVSKETALLLMTLQTISPLPQYAIAALGSQCDSVIGQMVLDGILEIEAEGQMLSGPAALESVLGRREAAKTETLLAALSLRALEYADALGTADPPTLSQRLYAYNRVPASPRWRRLLSDDAAVSRHLGTESQRLARMLSSSWVRVPSDAKGNGWTVWQSRRATLHRNAMATYKLYVSPACAELPAAFAATVEGLSRSASFEWKVGKNVFGLLRPDKIVAYFSEFADLQETAAHLAAKLEGCPAQGVPFSAEMGGGGLLSWGIDPPAEDHSVPWLERESWRVRICNRLAATLALAKTSKQKGMPAARFALERMRLDGIDTDTWTPLR